MLSVKNLFRAAALFLLVVTFFQAWGESRALASVTVQLNEGAEEPSDMALGAAARPDYRLDVEVGGSWEKLGSRKDTSAVDGITFEVVERIAVAKVTQVRLSEDDAVDDDPVETLEVDGAVVVGESFTFTLAEKRDVQVGIQWIFGTPMGMLMMFGTLILVLIAGIRAGLADLG